MSTLIATRDIPEEDVERGLTRVAEDHELVRRYPDAFKRDAYSDSVHRGAGLPPVNGKPDEVDRRIASKATRGPASVEMAANTRKPDGGEARRDVERVVLGKGKLTPTQDFRWRGELFTAGETRVAPEAAVCRDPEAARLLRPCWEEEYDARVVELFERSTGSDGIRGPGTRRLPRVRPRAPRGRSTARRSTTAPAGRAAMVTRRSWARS